MRITKSELLALIKESIDKSRLDEVSMGQAKAMGPLKDFVNNIESARQALGTNGAKKALSALYQQASSDDATQAHIETLLNAVNKLEASLSAVVKWLEHMPELTQDPWAGTRKRDD